MTNDTNTLNGALRELGETMAANLTTQGVASTWDEGLTTLAGKILDITPGPTPSYDGISLTGNKSILSAADSEYVTLTAQLTDEGSAAAVSGETVTFTVYKSSDDSVVTTLTDDTDSSGLATVSYYGQGTGDIYIQAECTFVSETYSIVDYWNIIPLDNTTDNKLTGTYTVGTIQSKTGLSSYGTDTHLSQNTFPTKFQITGELLKNGTNASYLVIGTDKDNGYMVGFDGAANSFSGYVRTGGSNSNRNQKTRISTDTWYPFTITVNGSSLTFVSNGLTITGTIPTNSITYIGWYNSSQSGYWRDLKVKQL